MVLGCGVLRDFRMSPAASTAYQRWRDVVLVLAASLIWLLVERLRNCVAIDEAATRVMTKRVPGKAR